MRKKFLLLVGVLGMSIVGSSLNNIPASATVPGSNTLVSVNRYGTAANTHGTSTDGGVLSHNGEYSVFNSGAGNIVDSDTNYKSDIFIRNLTNNTTTRVSVSTSGIQGDGDSQNAVISETGRYVVFVSRASNLIDGTTVQTTYSQLYLRDTHTNTTTLLSKNAAGTEANNNVDAEGVSSDGRFVLFTTAANNLTPAATNTGDNIYMLDRLDNSFTILNYKYDGSLPNSDIRSSARMSCDGSIVAFQVPARLTDHPNTNVNVYLLDRRAGNRLTNLTVNANSAAGAPTVSCNGNYIGFSSSAYNLDPTYTTNSGKQHAYVYDRIQETFTIVDKSSSGAIGASGVDCTVTSESCVQVSDNGIATFSSASSQLAGVVSSTKQIYIRHLKTATTELLSKDTSGTPGNLHSTNPSISTRGDIVGYASVSTNLVPLSDTNASTDAFTSLTGY